MAKNFNLKRRGAPGSGCQASSFAEKTMWRRLILILTLGAIAGIFVIPLNPVNSKILKLVLLGCIVGAWLGYTILLWKSKPCIPKLLVV